MKKAMGKSGKAMLSAATKLTEVRLPARVVKGNRGNADAFGSANHITTTYVNENKAASAKANSETEACFVVSKNHGKEMRTAYYNKIKGGSYSLDSCAAKRKRHMSVGNAVL